MKKKTKVACIITSYGAIDPDVYRNHISCLLQWDKHVELAVFHIDGVQQHDALNQMVKEAKKEIDPDYYMFLEHDNGYNKDTLKNLIAHDKDVVTGFYCLREWPFAPIPLVKLDKNKKELTRFDFIPHEGVDLLKKVDVGCFGCCLVKKRVLEKLGPKCFKYEYSEEESYNLLPDVVFFRDAKEKGFDVYVDGSERIVHFGRAIQVTPDNYTVLQDMHMMAYPELVKDRPEMKKIMEEVYHDFFEELKRKIAELPEDKKVAQ